MIKFFKKLFVKTKSKEIKLNMMLIMCMFSLLFLLSLVGYGYINLKYNAINFNFFLLWTFILVLITGAIIYLFLHKIYIPILKLDKAMKILEDVNTDFEIDFNNDTEVYPISITLNKMLKRLKDSMDREYLAKILKKQAEIDALQSQINPHFLYNTLEAIRGQALAEGVSEIADMTEALSRFFRYSISQKGNLVSLKEEIKNVENYFVIQQYRFNNKFQLLFKYDENNEDILEYLMPKLTIQPIVENAISHGLETKIGKGSVTIRIIATEKRLIISIIDDGIGMDNQIVENLNYRLNNSIKEEPTSSNKKHTGIALINVNERIKLSFGKQYGISIESTKSFGTDVEIILPLTKEEPPMSIPERMEAYEK